MVVFESISAISTADEGLVGSKAKALAELASHGFDVPPAMCISADGYSQYMSSTSLRERVLFELGRKRFEDMRWEEIWDAALRIRNLFLATPLPPALHGDLHAAIARLFGETPVVVRSSAPGEDSAEASFAGLHESFVNVRGPESVLKHVRLVWASLWSDAALLYRQELGLDVRHSRMAVIVQSMIEGECSGVVFSRDPGGANEAVIEAVYGLNAGLVDGTIEPDRWTVDRHLGSITSHTTPRRSHMMITAPSGIKRMRLDTARMERSPLGDVDVNSVYKLALSAEQQFGAPQDVEWTRTHASLSVLQSRPITTLGRREGDGDQRPWYRSLTRSFANLQTLRQRIEEQIIPGLQKEAEELAGSDPATLTDDGLRAESKRREEIYQRWRDVYWSDCIPFAHGVRLFGQYYNDVVQPRDPYEFMGILSGTPMLSVLRNQALETLAQMIRDNAALGDAVRRGDSADFPAEFRDALATFLQEHEHVPAAAGSDFSASFLKFLLELANAPQPRSHAPEDDAERLRRDFFQAVGDAERPRAEEMLDMARASHRWRDDDNVYLDAIETQWRLVQEEARRRGIDVPGEAPLRRHQGQPLHQQLSTTDTPLDPRQLVGQPAGPGLATGTARVVSEREELLAFKRGEVLVCDSLNPTMTFVIPLASAVVERRGGMLIHGAIIAREYGLPCVTGVPAAASLIRTGMRLTVDGYLGIVRIESTADSVTM